MACDEGCGGYVVQAFRDRGPCGIFRGRTEPRRESGCRTQRPARLCMRGCDRAFPPVAGGPVGRLRLPRLLFLRDVRDDAYPVCGHSPALARQAQLRILFALQDVRPGGVPGACRGYDRRRPNGRCHAGRNGSNGARNEAPYPGDQQRRPDGRLRPLCGRPPLPDRLRLVRGAGDRLGTGQGEYAFRRYGNL